MRLQLAEHLLHTREHFRVIRCIICVGYKEQHVIRVHQLHSDARLAQRVADLHACIAPGSEAHCHLCRIQTQTAAIVLLKHSQACVRSAQLAQLLRCRYGSLGHLAAIGLHLRPRCIQRTHQQIVRARRCQDTHHVRRTLQIKVLSLNMQQAALRHRAKDFVRALSAGIGAALQRGRRQQLAEAKVRAMCLIDKQHCTLCMTDSSNSLYICGNTIIVRTRQQHSLNRAVSKQSLLHCLRRNLRHQAKFCIKLRLHISHLYAAQDKSSGHAAVRITRQQQLFARVQRRQQHSMNRLARAVHRHKAGITAIGLRRQLLCLLDIACRLMNIIQLAHQRYIQLHARTQLVAQQTLHTAPALMSRRMQRINIFTFISQHRLYQGHGDSLFLLLHNKPPCLVHHYILSYLPHFS